MGYLETLHNAHKARLRRMGAQAATRGSKPEKRPLEKGPPPASGPMAEDSRPSAALHGGVAETPRQPTLFEIKVLVAKTYGISTADLESNSRAAKYLLPRSIAIHLAHRLTVQSWPQIALRFGGRHHSSALNADRRMAERRKQEPAFEAELCTLERQLTTP